MISRTIQLLTSARQKITVLVFTWLFPYVYLFPVSNLVDASGPLSKWNFSVFCCKYLCWRFCPSRGLLAVSRLFPNCLPCMLASVWPSDNFLAFYLPHLSQLSLAIICNLQEWRLLFPAQVQKAFGSPAYLLTYLLSMCHVALWTKSWLGPNHVAVTWRTALLLNVGNN